MSKIRTDSAAKEEEMLRDGAAECASDPADTAKNEQAVKAAEEDVDVADLLSSLKAPDPALSFEDERENAEAEGRTPLHIDDQPDVPEKPVKTGKKKKAEGKPIEEDGDDAGKELSLMKKESAPKTSSGNANAVYITCMCLLSPVILLTVFVILAAFLLLYTAVVVLAGIFALALVALVVGGVALALTGITYGLIEIVTKDGFELLAGEYELGLGMVITGITIIFSSLLYCGATGFVPFLMKKMFVLLKFIFRKMKDILKRIYNSATVV